MMNTDALHALATATLYPHLDSRPEGSAGTTALGTYPAYEVAMGAGDVFSLILETRRAGKCFDPSYSFKFGFELALHLGARLAEKPGQIPNVDDLLKALRSEVLCLKREIKRGESGYRLCDHEQEGAA